MSDEKKKLPGDDIAISVFKDGQRRDITVRELTVGNKLTCDALLSLLIEKGLIEPREIQQRIQQMTKQHFRPDSGETKQ